MQFNSSRLYQFKQIRPFVLRSVRGTVLPDSLEETGISTFRQVRVCMNGENWRGTGQLLLISFVCFLWKVDFGLNTPTVLVKREDGTVPKKYQTVSSDCENLCLCSTSTETFPRLGCNPNPPLLSYLLTSFPSYESPESLISVLCLIRCRRGQRRQEFVCRRCSRREQVLLSVGDVDGRCQKSE